MNFSDISIIISCLVTAGIFSVLGTDRLYRFYFGLIIGFLLFLVFNLQIKIVGFSGTGFGLSGWESFLVKNKQSILGFFTFMIPIFGFLFAFIDSEIKSNKVFSLLFGFLLPSFLLGVFGYVFKDSAVPLDFLNNFVSFFKDSRIFDVLQNAPKLIFGMLLIIIFWKYIFAIILTFLGYIARLIMSEINDLRGVEEQEDERKEETKRVKLN